MARKKAATGFAPWAGFVLLSAVFLALAWAVLRAGADAAVSPINGRALDPRTARGGYRFLLVGHTHGSHNRSIYSSASLLANLDIFNAQGVRFVVLLGDMLKNVEEMEIEAFKRSFAAKVSRPVFNAIGNHDNGGRDLYLKHFGPKTYYSFKYGSELFVFLDGEKDAGKIAGEQSDFMLGEIERARRDDSIKNLFVFTHRLLWAIGNPPLDRILPSVNGPMHHPAAADDFARLLLPELKSLKGKKVYLAAGDIGADWSFPLFYHEDPGGVLAYLAVGVGDNKRDHAVEASVAGGRVALRPVSLSGYEMRSPVDGGILPLEHFGLRFWLELGAARDRARASGKR